MSDWTVLFIVPAFGIDTLAVATGLGAAGVAMRRRLAVVIALFEGGMPLVGALIGNWLGHFIAGYAVWASALLLAILGVREVVEGVKELREGDEHDAGEGALMRDRIARAGLIMAGLSVSMDELAMGFAAGAAQLPIAVLAPALALQAAVFTFIGLHLGSRLRILAGRYGEIVAGVALFLAAFVVVLVAH